MPETMCGRNGEVHQLKGVPESWEVFAAAP
jgi:hypothetical protein